MSIEPVRVSIPCRLSMDQAMEHLMNWLASAGVNPQPQGPDGNFMRIRKPRAHGISD